MLLKRQANALRRFGLGLAAITALVGCTMAVFDVGLALAVLVWGLAGILAAFAVWTPQVHEPFYRATHAILGFFRRNRA